MSDVPEKFEGKYYDEAYFAIPKGKKFRRADGSLDAWSYQNLSGDSPGCEQIVNAWKTMFNCKTMLDIGCGRGTLLAYARKAGIEAVGFDFSEWGVNDGRFIGCKREWVQVHDATKAFPYPDKSFDLVTALDLLEHIYTPDLPFVISELQRVAKKWIFLQIAVAADGGIVGKVDREYTLEKGKPVPIEIEANAVAGHVTVVHSNKWEDWFDHEDWTIRKDMVQWFIGLVPTNAIHNWLLNLMLVLERN